MSNVHTVGVRMMNLNTYAGRSPSEQPLGARLSTQPGTSAVPMQFWSATAMACGYWANTVGQHSLLGSAEKIDKPRSRLLTHRHSWLCCVRVERTNTSVTTLGGELGCQGLSDSR